MLRDCFAAAKAFAALMGWAPLEGRTPECRARGPACNDGNVLFAAPCDALFSVSFEDNRRSDLIFQQQESAVTSTGRCNINVTNARSRRAGIRVSLIETHNPQPTINQSPEYVNANLESGK
ncbi:MAG: hypothetical protein GY815_05825 [Gammaproteobacteria bacterium]|nr:hypothetical protein [Gammaproteobacteria bacterium]